MNVNDHPELEVLQNYLNNSASAEFSSLRMHLAQCSQCRTLVDGLSNLHDITQQNTGSLTEDQYQQIDNYINDRLDASQLKSVKAFIDSNPLAMKAALHYASVQSNENRLAESDTAAASSLKTSRHNSFLSTISAKIRQLFSYQTPVWITAPAVAVIVALFSLNIFEQDSDRHNYKIASYQDNAIIQFRPKNSLPGIGFFAKQENNAVNYSGVDITVSGNNDFIIQWPAIEKAVKYNLRLQVFDQGNKKTIGDITTDKNSVLISNQLKSLYHRYEWVLTGETSDKLTFMANGGFVINNFDKGRL